MILLIFLLVYLVSFTILLINHYRENKPHIVDVEDLINSIKHEEYIWFPFLNTLCLIGIVIIAIAWGLWLLFRLNILWEKVKRIKLR